MNAIIVILSFVLLLSANVFSFDVENGISDLYATNDPEPGIVLGGPEGNVWLGGTWGVSILKLKDRTDPSENEIKSIFFDNDTRNITIDGNMAYVVGKSGFIKYDISDSSMESMTLLPSDNCFSTAFSDGELYIGTYKGLAKTTSGEVLFPDTGITKVVSGKNGEIWSYGGTFVAMIKGSEITIYDKEELGSIADLAIDMNGEPWISADGALWNFSQGSWTKVQDNVPFFDGNKMLIDSFNVVWGVSKESGKWCLVRYDIATEDLDFLHFEDDLPWVKIPAEGLPFVALGLDIQGRLLIGGENKVAYITDNNSPVITPLHIARNSGAHFTRTGFYLPVSANISLESYTLSGRLISKTSGLYSAGEHSFSSSFSKKLASGESVLRLTVNGKTYNSRASVLK